MGDRPQDRQNNELTNVPPAGLNRFVQDGVTPEQFAENARRLETFNRANAMALQVYLQRESQQAAQRRQDELRLIQQQLTSGSQQQHPPSLPPPLPQPTYHHYAPPRQPIAPRNAPVQIHNHGQSHNNANIINPAAQHRSYMEYARRASAQHQVQHQQQHHPSVSASAAFGNQGMHPPHEANLGPQMIGRAGIPAASTLRTFQTAQAPSAVRKSFGFAHHTPQYPQYSVPATSSQTSSGHASASGRTANYSANLQYSSLEDRYASWVRSYGPVKAASMAEECMQSWKSQVHPSTSIPHSTVAPPAISMSTGNLQRPNPIQVSKQEGVAVPPPPQPQEWGSSAPVGSAHGRQTASQHAPAAPPSHAPLTPANELTTETNSVRLARGTGDAYNVAEAQSHHPEVTASSGVVLSTDGLLTHSAPPNSRSDSTQSHHPEVTTSSGVVLSTDGLPTLSAPPSSQSDSTQSILLASEEKGKALYSLHGLAASIKRSLNAERLAASVKPSASSDPHGQTWKPLNSIEAVDTQHQIKASTPDLAIGKPYEQGPESKAGTQSVNIITEPVDSPSTIPPVTLSEVSIPHEETTNEFQIPNSQHDPSPTFTPYSSLTGAVSFDNVTDSAPVDPNPASCSEATGVFEDTTTPQILLHDHVEDALIPDQPSFETLSFPHRIPTPPLAATITIVDDEGEIDEKARSTPSSRPSTPLHDMEIDSQLEYIPSGNEDDIEMSSIPGEGDIPIQPDIASSEFSKAWDNAALMQEADVSAHQATSLDRPVGETDQGSKGSPTVEEHLGNERRSSTQAPEELARVLPKTSPSRVQSTDSAETSSRVSSSKLARKSRGKQKFYIAVPPASEWVLEAKRREEERKRLTKEKAGQHDKREYAECELANRLCRRHCHWNGCQAVLNSMYALKQHVRQHQLEVKPVGPAMTVSCRWKQCRMVCERSSLLLHLNRHVDKGVTCIYDDCDEHFSRIQDLVEHERIEHANDEPPPSAIPQPPELRCPVTLPQTVPSYTMSTRPTSKPSITAERHARLGPWTLGMIIGDPTAGPDSGCSNTALRIRRTARLTDKSLDVTHTPMLTSAGKNGETSPNREFLRQSAEYDILEEPSVASSRVFGELDSVGVTGEFYEGSGRMMRVGTPLSGGTESDSALVEGLL